MNDNRFAKKKETICEISRPILYLNTIHAIQFKRNVANHVRLMRRDIFTLIHQCYFPRPMVSK